jgi:TonB family protein
MRHFLKTIVLVSAVILVQACGPKKANDGTLAADSIKATTADAVSAEQAKENKRAERIRMKEEKQKAIEAKWAAEKEFYTNDKGVIIYYRPETKPSFKGGDEAMNKYVSDNLKYPESATSDWEGTIFVDFIVENDGTVSNVEIAGETEGAEQVFRDEATRVIKSMPTWVPGKHRGKPVLVKYDMPITFKTF